MPELPNSFVVAAASLALSTIALAQGRSGTPPQLPGGDSRGSTSTQQARRAFVQDLSRDEDPATIVGIIPFLQDPAPLVRREAAFALAHRLIGTGATLRAAANVARDALLARLSSETDFDEAGRTMLRALGELPNADATTIAYLLEQAKPHFPDNLARRLAATEGMEALVRQGVALGPTEAAVRDLMEHLAVRSVSPSSPAAPFLPAMQILRMIGAEPQTIITAARYHCRDSATCGWPFRLIAAQMIDVADEQYDDVLRQLLADNAFQVRLEAVRAFAKRVAIKPDCQAIIDAFDDPMPLVAAGAFDVVDARCTRKEEIVERLTREAADLMDADKKDAWYLPLHAYQALARLAPAAARDLLPRVAAHPRWPVRSAAATVAGQLRVEQVALSLAADVEPKVRTDAMTALRAIGSLQLEAVARRELDRLDGAGESIKAPDVGSLWSATTALRGHVQYDDLTLMLRLLKLPQTSRLARLAALDRIKELGKPDERGISALRDNVRDVQVYVNDPDAPVGIAAAEAVESITGRRPARQPQRNASMFRAADFPFPPELRITMARGDQILMELDGDEAPATATRILARLFDSTDAYRGTTFHRLLPNVLLQGGSRDGSDWSASPCETEARARPTRIATNSGSTTVSFSHACEFWKDEFNPLRHERGAVALATNGPNTGIGQFFIELVDLPAFDHQYSVIGHVVCVKGVRALPFITEDPVDLIEQIAEGEEIQRVDVPKPRVDRHGWVCRTQ